MSQTLNIANFNSQNILAQTPLTGDIASGVNSLPVANSGDFASGGYVLIGNVGSETAELLTATAPSSGTAIPLSSTTKLGHNFNEAATLLFGSQINVYRATDVSGNGTQPPDANFTKIATINIDPSKPQTAYTDATGTAGNWYKFTYFNPTTSAETNIADSRAGQAGQVLYVSVDQVRNAAGFANNPRITNAKIMEFILAAQNEVNGALQAVYELPLPQPTNPIVVQITKNIAAGELMHEMYLQTSPTLAAEGETKASLARNGGGSHTSLAELVDRAVVLMDANFMEETIDEAHGFGGWPDETTAGLSKSAGGDCGFHFTVDKEY